MNNIAEIKTSFFSYSCRYNVNFEKAFLTLFLSCFRWTEIVYGFKECCVATWIYQR